MIPKITTFLMFNGEAEEAINFYTSIFKDSEILTLVKYGEEGPGEPGTVQHSKINGQIFMGIDQTNGVEIEMNPAMSLYVTCESAMEMEHLYSKLKSGGAILMPKTELPPTFREFAWVQDKFGVNFQLALPEQQS